MSDYISREKALIMINAVIEGDESNDVIEALDRVRDNIASLPAADVAPVVHDMLKESEDEEHE